MRTIPVDLILHSLLDLLRAVPADTPGTTAEALALCIDHRRVAEEWQADGDPAQAADWLRRRLDQRDTPIASLVGTDTRTIEVAVARRLADVAFALCIEQTAEATAHASTLLRAAQAIVGLVVETRNDFAPHHPDQDCDCDRLDYNPDSILSVAIAAGATMPTLEILGHRHGKVLTRLELAATDNHTKIATAIIQECQTGPVMFTGPWRANVKTTDGETAFYYAIR